MITPARPISRARGVLVLVWMLATIVRCAILERVRRIVGRR